MNGTPRKHADQMNTLLQVWTALNSTRSFSGLSLRELRTGFQPSIDARQRVAAAQAELSAATQERGTADFITCKLYKRAISAIKADPHEGEDGPMYKAVTSGTRRSHRSGTHSPVPAAPMSELSIIKPAA